MNIHLPQAFLFSEALQSVIEFDRVSLWFAQNLWRSVFFSRVSPPFSTGYQNNKYFTGPLLGWWVILWNLLVCVHKNTLRQFDSDNPQMHMAPIQITFCIKIFFIKLKIFCKRKQIAKNVDIMKCKNIIFRHLNWWMEEKYAS